MPDTELLTRLRELLTERFSDSELRTLYFDLGENYDNLPGSGKADKARELVDYLDRHGRLPDLLRVGRKLRPDVPWPEGNSVSNAKTPSPAPPAASAPPATSNLAPEPSQEPHTLPNSGLPVWVRIFLGVIAAVAVIGAALIGIRAAGEPVRQAARFTATTEARQTSVALSMTQTATPAPTATWTPATSSIATLSTTPNPTAFPTISSTLSPTYGPYFNVYTAGYASDNHFTPTNYMGDLGDITIDENWEGDSDPAHGSVIKIIYDPRGRGDDNDFHTCIRNEPTNSTCKWAGVFWTRPENNWGELPGYDLTGFTKLTFWARRDEQPVVAQFQVGGIGRGIPTPPPYPDSIRDPVKTGWRPLNTQWTPYEILLTGQNLSNVTGGFAWVISWANAAISAGSPPLVFYLDDIRFER